VPLDPIVQLAVGMATSPGSYAVVVGSGVSLEAGVPTGEQVLTATKQRMYAAANPGQPADLAQIAAWLAEQGLADSSYSELLAQAFPGEQSRRDYLASFFDGTTPGPSHLALARLAAAGLVRVLVTTNFDTHLEDAMRAAGVQPVVVSDQATLDRAPARETSAVFVVKAHGDVGQVNIRNTLAELDDLGERTQRELDEICSRLGVIVLGYSGRDAALGRALRLTSPRFGIYWVSRRSPTNAEAEAIITAASGRLIVRDGAAEFLTDLEARLAPLLEHPSGVTPTSVRAEMISRLRSDGDVGVRELLREEQRVFETSWARRLREAHQRSPGPAVDRDAMLELEQGMRSALNRHLAAVLPVIEYDVAALQIELDWIAAFADLDSGVTSPYSAWIQANRVPVWHLVWALAAACYALRRFDVMRLLWDTTTRDGNPLPLMLQLGGSELESKMHVARSGHPPVLDGLTHTARIMRDGDLLDEHYPELIRGPWTDPLSATIGNLQNASYLYAAMAGRRGTPTRNYAYGQPSHSTASSDIERPNVWRDVRRDLFEDDPDVPIAQVIEWAGTGGY